ncbi:ABC transporter permease [Solwaraspora sp. WMMD1047]|uniref:ABC transporter permease n=1 Tax=Solwaraspora sp. WMMD1047 TaxID=3016102 RepID=UPI002418085D|nr:ABC transporter permease [Solwaraspora sp. WMMD1047]MDG4827772.1 ABC transporter permease [Solwaraspora sp. WMMD1047]
MKALAIGMLSLRRLFRDRNNIFFVLVVPFMMIFVIGLLFGGGQQLRLGVVGGADGPLADRLVTALGAGDRIVVEPAADEAQLRAAVERGDLHAGLIIPPGYDADLRAGDQVGLRYLTRPEDQAAQDVGVWVRSVVPQEAALLRGAQFGVAEGAGSFDDRLAAAESAPVAGIDVAVTTTGEALFPPGFSQFNVSAPPLLLLFIFLTSLTAAVGLVQSRRSGVSRRMYATPTRLRTIMIGEAAGRLIVALTQGLIIMLGSALLFGVDWGDPLAASALLSAFALVGSGAATLLGALVRDEGAAVALAPVLGLGLGALGGTMLHLESFGDTMRTVAHITPHAWGYDAFVELVRRDAGIGGILPELGILTGYALVLFALGLWRLRTVLTR